MQQAKHQEFDKSWTEDTRYVHFPPPVRYRTALTNTLFVVYPFQARQAHRQLARVPDGPHGEEGQGLELQGGEQGGGEARRGQDGDLEEELEINCGGRQLVRYITKSSFFSQS